MGHRLLPHHPELYHGKENSRPYFEGWYFKQTSEAGSFSVIPGVFRGRSPADDIAFIQVIFGSPAQSFFIPYPISSFFCRTKKFEMRVGESFFTMEGITLDIRKIRLNAELKYTDITPLKTTLLSPSIMGWFSYLPAMQCNHGVLSLNHRVDGRVECAGRNIEFESALGYIEKDWGESFPESWVWMQCSGQDFSLMCAVASIPYGPLYFGGLICVLRGGESSPLRGSQLRFATYNGGKVRSLAVRDGALEAEITNNNYTLNLTAQSDDFGTLKAPSKAGMNRDITESIDAKISFELSRSGVKIFSGACGHAGLELFNAGKLLNNSKK